MADLLSMLSEIADADLRARIVAEVTSRGSHRPFGLVFEDTVEELDLVDAPVRRGDRVQYRDGGAERFEVLSVKAGAATLRPMSQGPRGRWHREAEAETLEVPVEQIMVTVDHDTKVYPGLVQTGSVGEVEGGRPSHVAIAGENLHALRALKYTHRASVDLCYLDPPYNTGNKEWVYNDRWVDSNDSFRHSKWLAFMRRRLKLAHDLLKDTGVIIVAIGDDEHHRLRMLMDEVFGESNFVSNITWRGGRKNYGHLVAQTTDYMLVYAKNLALSLDLDRKWRESKDGVDRIRAASQSAWDESGGDALEATRLFRAWWKALPKDDPARQSKHYNRVDDVRPGEPYFGSDLSNPDPTWINRFDLLHPTTGQAVPQHRNGWRYTQKNMERLVSEGRIAFGPTDRTTATFKKYLDESADQAPENVFYMDRRRAPKHLENVLSDKRFPFPKDHEVLMRWFRMAAPKDGVILDFFGGSGSTAEAVMRLNAEDGGTRQCILVTNNEVAATEEKKLRKLGHLPGSDEWKAAGVFERVTRLRLTTILTGKREDGSSYDSPIDGDYPQRVEFFDLGYVSPKRARLNLEWKRLAPLLWMRGGGLGDIPSRVDESYVVTEGFAAIWGGDQARALAAELTDQRVVFIVTDSEAEFVAAAKHFDGFECRHLWNDYLGEN